MVRKQVKTLSLFELMQKYPDDASALRYLESVRWGASPVCVRCGAGDRVKTQSRTGLYWCGHCRKCFTARTNTPLEGSNIGMRKWVYASYFMVTARKGISSVQLSKELAVTQKTAWYMLQRLRAGCADYLSELFGTVEVDATYLGGKEKNKHESRKRHLGTGMVDKQGVLGMYRRGDDGACEVRLFPIVKETREAIGKLVVEHIASGSLLLTDEHAGYECLDGFEHRSLNHSAKQFVDGMAHTNSIESVWALLKRGFTGTYHHWSMKHCGLYINEFAFRLNEGACYRDTQERQDALFRIMFGKTLTYQELTA